MKSCRVALIQYDWRLYFKGKFGHRDDVKTGEDGHPQARERSPGQVLLSQSSEGTSPAGSAILGRAVRGRVSGHLARGTSLRSPGKLILYDDESPS